jgi:hypothetical protein
MGITTMFQHQSVEVIGVNQVVYRAISESRLDKGEWLEKMRYKVGKRSV